MAFWEKNKKKTIWTTAFSNFKITLHRLQVITSLLSLHAVQNPKPLTPIYTIRFEFGNGLALSLSSSWKIFSLLFLNFVSLRMIHVPPPTPPPPPPPQGCVVCKNCKLNSLSRGSSQRELKRLPISYTIFF